MRKKINNFFKTQIILTHIIANIHSINSVQFILYRKNAKFQSEFFSTTSKFKYYKKKIVLNFMKKKV